MISNWVGFGVFLETTMEREITDPAGSRTLNVLSSNPQLSNSTELDWIGLAQDRDRWRALVNLVSNLEVR
jgi:hypothetical protein